MSPNPVRPLLCVRSRLTAGTMTTPVAIAAAVAGIGAYAFYMRRSASANTAAAAKEPFASFGFHNLRLQSSELVNHNTKRLRFELPDPNVKSGLSLTSAVLTISFPNGGWIPCIRPYTPTNDLNEKGFIDLMVKLYPNGKQSTHLHSLKPGDTLRFAPIKEIAWTPNQHPHVALIAGGAGITPMYQLTRGILSNPKDKTRITLVWGVNSDEDIFLRDEFARLEREHPGQFRATYVVSRPEEGSKLARGFVNREVLEGAGIGGEKGKEDVKVLVCGPPAMEKTLTGSKGMFASSQKGVLHEMGFRGDQIHRF
ncbi:ferredoxin reductase-like protein [Coniochaeta sp. 2T2.1]|nr:ferredoxin reductase-like protein [Coniochaeta sp. 2T2.1]